jgi:hypothetical protein
LCGAFAFVLSDCINRRNYDYGSIIPVTGCPPNDNITTPKVARRGLGRGCDKIAPRRVLILRDIEIGTGFSLIGLTSLAHTDHC